MEDNVSAEIDLNLGRAVRLLQKAYERQSAGDYEEAILLYKASIEACPTAEAHTYLGWTYSFLKRYDEAIEQCKIAITLDPEFGNPYNDIGSYLIHKGQIDKAIPWLEQAKKARRYEPRHFPYLNLYRVYMKLGHLDKAQRELQQALFIQQSLELQVGGSVDDDANATVN
ncbi:MAG: tetratricopeptide repeat protein [Acidobacteria bacterium]|nr:tetratricopeptide repeat protein [Acidobacteriota bacterium]